MSPGCALSEWGPVGHRSVIDPHVGSVLGTLPGQGPLDMTILMTRQDTSRHTVCRFLVQGQQEDTRTGNLKSSHPMCFLLVCCQARLLTRITSVWGPVHVLESVENGDLGFSILKITTICVCLLSRRCAVGRGPHTGILSLDLQAQEPEDITCLQVPVMFRAQGSWLSQGNM